MRGAEVITELGRFPLPSGRELRFELEEHLETEAMVLLVVSQTADGRRYVVRLPRVAVPHLRLALDAFDGVIAGTP